MFIKKLTLTSAVLLFLLIACQQQPKLGIDTPVRIMPLGDSITEGLCDSQANCNIPEIKRPTDRLGDAMACNWSLNSVNPKASGYRAFLSEKLLAEGYQFAYVGSVSVVEGMTHEGHSGWTINDLDYCIQNADWLQDANPDIILLHIGTNDIIWAREPDMVATDLSVLLKHIYEILPKKTYVIVAQIISAKSKSRQGYVPLPAEANELIADYNAKIPGVVDQFNKEGMNVSYVDMGSVINSDADLDYLGLHPNATASERMAVVWFDKIKEILTK